MVQWITELIEEIKAQDRTTQFLGLLLAIIIVTGVVTLLASPLP